jgi:cadmium resistance protein CadD (predicted permease)
LEQSVELIGVAIVLFVATNLDDVFLLLAFFADRTLRAHQIFIGQFAGIALLYGASLAASLAAVVIPAIYIGLLGLVPIAIGAFKLWELHTGDDDDEPLPAARGGAIAVAAITLASGGDNIAVYTPVFALRTLAEVLVIGCVFAIMIVLWLAAARWLTKHPTLGAPIRRWGGKAVPFVLIGIGVLVLVEARTWQLLS